MIRESSLETVLEVKEALSSDGNYFRESMAPLIGGVEHGSLSPINKLHPFADREWDINEITEGRKTVYSLHTVLLSVHPTIETMKVFVEERYSIVRERFETVLTPKTIDALLESWACDWYEELGLSKMEGL